MVYIHFCTNSQVGTDSLLTSSCFTLSLCYFKKLLFESRMTDMLYKMKTCLVSWHLVTNANRQTVDCMDRLSCGVNLKFNCNGYSPGVPITIPLQSMVHKFRGIVEPLYVRLSQSHQALAEYREKFRNKGAPVYLFTHTDIMCAARALYLIEKETTVYFNQW